MSETYHNRHGVSLIELLVVIAIISVLLAVSLPALSRVRASARWVQCGSNLKQVGLLTEQSMERFDEVFVFFLPGKPMSVPEQRLSIESAFEGVTTSFEAWICPSNPADEDSRWWNSYRYFPGERLNEHPNEGRTMVVDEISVRYLPARDTTVWGDQGDWHGEGRRNSVSYPVWTLSAN